MIRRLLPFLLLFITFYGQSQSLSHVTFTGATTLSSFSFKTDQQVIIKVTEDGKIIEWGTEWEPRRYNYVPGKLEPFMGRVDYYGQEADSIARGKVKSIGTTVITYFGAYEAATKAGKIKSIGSVAFDYFSNYENVAIQGKIQFAGTVVISFYPAYENEAFRGKLKSVGNNQITYYSTFDDKSIRGKLKSIGSNNYIWYTSNDQYRGGLKSGAGIRTLMGSFTLLCNSNLSA